MGQTFPLGFAHPLGGHAAGFADDPRNIRRGQRALLRRAGFGHNTRRGRRFVQQVDGLVRQAAPRQIAHAQFHRGVDRFGRDGDAVVAFIPGHQPAQDRFGVGRGGFLHHYLAEAAFQRRIFLDRAAVFLGGGRADQLDLAAGQHGFQDTGGVDGAFRRTGPGNDVDLVNKQNCAAVPVEFFQQILEPFLKIAAVFGAGHHRRHIQRQQPLVAQKRRDLPGGDPLGQCFGQGAFAHARLPQQAGVVLLAAAEDLDHAVEFLFPAKHRVQSPFLRQPGQVPAIFFAGLSPACGRHPRLGGQHHLAGDLPAFPRRLGHLDAQRRHPQAGRAGGVLQHGAEQMLVFRPRIPGRMGPQHGKFHRLPGLCRQRAFLPERQPRPLPARRNAGAQRRFRHALAPQKIRRRAARRAQHRQQQVAGIGLGAALTPRQAHRRAQCAGGPAGKSFIMIQQHPNASSMVI